MALELHHVMALLFVHDREALRMLDAEPGA
jgi:hypothetical protein